MKSKRLFSYFLTLLFLAGVLWIGVEFSQNYREYRQFKKKEMATQARLDEISRQFAEQQRISERLVQDRAYVELMIRRRLNFAKPEEKIFRFEER